MLLIPTHYADLVLGADWRGNARYDALLSGGVVVGRTLEIDLDQLGGTGADAVRHALDAYATACRRLAGGLAHDNPIGPWVITRRPLVVASQQAGTRSAQRGDLHDELEGLREFEDTERIVDALLGPVVAASSLYALGATAVAVEDGRTTVTLPVEGFREWRAALGGTPGPNEIERHFTLVANHAAWRDRAVRRLVRVETAAVELLPDPAPFRPSWSQDAGAPVEDAVLLP